MKRQVSPSNTFATSQQGPVRIGGLKKSSLNSKKLSFSSQSGKAVTLNIGANNTENESSKSSFSQINEDDNLQSVVNNDQNKSQQEVQENIKEENVEDSIKSPDIVVVKTKGSPKSSKEETFQKPQQRQKQDEKEETKNDFTNLSNAIKDLKQGQVKEIGKEENNNANLNSFHENEISEFEVNKIQHSKQDPEAEEKEEEKDKDNDEEKDNDEDEDEQPQQLQQKFNHKKQLNKIPTNQNNTFQKSNNQNVELIDLTSGNVLQKGNLPPPKKENPQTTIEEDVQFITRKTPNKKTKISEAKNESKDNKKKTINIDNPKTINIDAPKPINQTNLNHSKKKSVVVKQLFIFDSENDSLALNEMEQNEPKLNDKKTNSTNSNNIEVEKKSEKRKINQIEDDEVNNNNNNNTNPSKKSKFNKTKPSEKSIEESRSSENVDSIVCQNCYKYEKKIFTL